MKPAKRVITSRHCQLDLRTFLKSEFKFNPLFWGTTKNITSIANLNTMVCYLQPGFLTISLPRKKILDPLWLAASAKETSWSREDPGFYHRAPWLNDKFWFKWSVPGHRLDQLDDKEWRTRDQQELIFNCATLILKKLSHSTKKFAQGQCVIFQKLAELFRLIQPTRMAPCQFVFLFADHSKDIFHVDLCHLILNPVQFAIFRLF